MKSILIRADASLLIGSGHVIRCRTLARELRRRGADVTFLCRPQSGDLISLLQQEFTVLVLPVHLFPAPLPSELDSLTGRDLYATWLGCSQQQDATDCLQVLRNSGLHHPSWVVVDHYGLDVSWESQFVDHFSSDSRPTLLVIDDLADRSHIADCLLDQNFFGASTESRYKHLLPQHCIQLLGPHYALLGSEYAQLHSLIHHRTDLKRVLVFFGGSDPLNLTGMALEALMASELAELSVDVVIGLQSTYRKEVEELVSNRPFTTLHDPLPSLAGLITRADIAIGAGGATTWERACLGLPSLVITTASNQLPFIEALHEAGFLHFLGHHTCVTVTDIRNELLARLSYPIRKDRAMILSDGWGASRLAVAMLGLSSNINCKPAKSNDQSLMMHSYHNFQFNLNFFSLSAEDCSAYQLECMHDSLDSVANDFLLLEARSDCPVGHLSFKFLESVDEASSKTANIIFNMDPCILEHKFDHKLIEIAFQLANQISINHTYFSSTTIFSKKTILSRDLQFSGQNQINTDSFSLPPSRITILSESISWINAFLPELIRGLWQRGHVVRWIHSSKQLVDGDVCLLLSCGQILTSKELNFHKYNLVVHESDLPKGQGWSPMSWQIIQGAKSIPITLFEATQELDAGQIYLQSFIALDDTELVDEWRLKQATATIDLCFRWFDQYDDIRVKSKKQIGESTYYPRRRPSDSEINPNLSIISQFNLLRIVDNSAYPAFFEYAGKRYQLKISSSANNAN